MQKIYKKIIYLKENTIFVRNGIHSDADYYSSRVGVGVVVFVVVGGGGGGGFAIFKMGYHGRVSWYQALSYQANFLYGDFP